MKLGFMFAFILLAIFIIATSVYGLVLAFKASLILGFLALIIEPSPYVFGLIMILLNKNIPEMIMEFLKK